MSRDYIKRPRAANLAEITPEQQNNTVVVAQVGGSASIKCYTHFIGDETVSNNLQSFSFTLPRPLSRLTPFLIATPFHFSFFA